MADLLIHLVKKHPILYDNTVNTNKDNHTKNLIWEEIARKLRLRSGALARTKWRNARDSYVKFLKTRIKEAEAHAKGIPFVRKKVRWPWAQRMQFLNPFISILNNQAHQYAISTELVQQETNAGPDEDGISEPEEDTFDSDAFDDDDDFKFDQESTPLEFGDAPDLQVTHSCPEENSKPSNHHHEFNTYPLPRIKLEPGQCTYPTLKSADDENRNTFHKTLMDPLDLLLLSYSETLKRLAPRRQAVVKLHIAQIMHKAEIEEILERDQQ